MASFARSFPGPSRAGLAVVPLTGLDPATRYSYAVQSGGATLAEGHFVTAPRPGQPVTFLVYGDDRTDDAAHAAVVAAMAAAPADFVVQTGDMVADGVRQLSPPGSASFDIEHAFLSEHAVFAAIGNHELVDDLSGSAFLRYFGTIDPTPPNAAHAYGTARVGKRPVLLPC